MGFNQTVESPNYEKISKEAGNFTADAINLLWIALNDTRATERRDFRLSREILAPKVLDVAAAASVNDLDLQGASVISLTGGSAQNVTGFRAPETGKTRIVFCQVNGAGTITFKHNATSETANQLVLSTGADTARASGQGIVFVYLASKYREVARSG